MIVFLLGEFAISSVLHVPIKVGITAVFPVMLWSFFDSGEFSKQNI